MGPTPRGEAAPEGSSSALGSLISMTTAGKGPLRGRLAETLWSCRTLWKISREHYVRNRPARRPALFGNAGC